jgi:thiamine transport system substrate-binding protein
MRYRVSCIIAAALASLTATAVADDEPTLRILAHDYYSASDEAIEAFEEEHGAKVEIIGGGDANQVVETAIRQAGKPQADLLFGVDNLVYRRAVEAGIFEEYDAARRGDIPADIRAQFNDSPFVTPIDYGYVTLNWDKAAEGKPPETFEDLTGPEWRGKLVVEDPSLSSPGLQFLLTTIAYFGEDADYTWKDFWSDLKANDVFVAKDWGEAYTERFTVRGGDKPLVVSYTSSPAAEVHFSEGALEEPPTANVIPGPLFRQVEAIGVLKGAEHPELARAFIDYMLTDAYQMQIPPEDHVYPVIPGLEMPEWWRWADADVEAAKLDASQHEIDAWVQEWSAIMID